MTEITEKHREWATVDRMRDMLGSIRRDYEITQTYTLFAGILCWTIQRIRSKEDGSALTERFRNLRKTLEKEPFDRLLRDLRAAPRSINRDSNIAFDDLSPFADTKETPNSLQVFVALRNAAAHGDARRVTPVNNAGRLTGYKFICGKEDENKGVWTWRVDIALNRVGMQQIADELATRFCDAAIDPTGGASLIEARKLREAS